MSVEKRNIFKLLKEDIISGNKIKSVLIDIIDNETLLFIAIKAENLDAIKSILFTNKNALYVQVDGIFPFYYACSVGNINIVKCLYSFDKQQISFVNMGSYSMYVSCYNGHIDVVKFICEQGHQEQLYIASNGIYPFYACCYTNSLDVVEYLLTLDKKLLHQESCQGRPFKAVCTNIDKSIDIVKRLIQYNPKIIDTTLVIDNLDILKMLCEDYNFIPHKSTILEYKDEFFNYVLDKIDFDNNPDIFEYLTQNCLDKNHLKLKLKFIISKISEKTFKQCHRHIYDNFVNKYPTYYKHIHQSTTQNKNHASNTKHDLINHHLNNPHKPCKPSQPNDIFICDTIEMLVSMHNKGIIYGDIKSDNFLSSYYSDQHSDMFNDFEMFGLTLINKIKNVNINNATVSHANGKFSIESTESIVITSDSVDSIVGFNTFNILCMLLSSRLNIFLETLVQIGDEEYSEYVSDILYTHISDESLSPLNELDIIHDSYMNDTICFKYKLDEPENVSFDMEIIYDVIFNAVMSCRNNKTLDYKTAYKYYEYVIVNKDNNVHELETNDVIFLWPHVKFLVSKLDQLLEDSIDVSIIAEDIYKALFKLELDIEYNSWNFVASVVLYSLSQTTQYTLKYLVSMLTQINIHINKTEMTNSLKPMLFHDFKNEK